MVCWAPKIVSIALTVCFGVLAGCSFVSCDSKTEVLPYYNTPQFDPIFIADKADVESIVTHQVSDFSFTDQDNKVITQGTIDGKIHVANFVFTTCNSICPKMINNMKTVSEAFQSDRDVVLLSYSVTPWIDDVERLRAYADEKEISSANWHLLTGNKSRIYELARHSYFAEQGLGFSRDSTDFLHTEHFILVDRTKRIRGIYNGTLQLEMQQLIKDIQTLKDEE
jgi:protein SCO1